MNNKHFEITSFKSRDFFSKERYKNLVNLVLDYLSYQNIISISQINKIVFSITRNRINTHEIKELNKKYFTQNNQVASYKTFRDFDTLLYKILNDEVEISTQTIFRHVCFYLQKTFNQQINIRCIDNVDVLINSLEYLKEFDLSENIKHIEISDLHLNFDIFFKLTKNIFQPLKFSSQIRTIDLSDNFLDERLVDFITLFIQKSTCIENIYLNNCDIGNSDECLIFLDTLNSVKTLKNVSLIGNDYSSDSIEIIRKILKSEDNSFNLNLSKNRFFYEECIGLLKETPKKNNRTFSMSAIKFNEYSPIYYVNSRFGVEYNDNYTVSNIDNFLDGLDIEELRIRNFGYLPNDLQNLNKIFNKENLKSVHFDINFRYPKLIKKCLLLENSENIKELHLKNCDEEYIDTMVEYLQRYDMGIPTITIDNFFYSKNWINYFAHNIKLHDLTNIEIHNCQGLGRYDLIKLLDAIETNNCFKLLKIQNCGLKKYLICNYLKSRIENIDNVKIIIEN